MPSEPRFLNPSSLPAPLGDGYSHAVEVRGGRTVYLSGQVGMTPDGTLLEGFEAQCVQAFENLRLALEATGMTLEHLVKINLYVTDMAHVQTLRAVRDRFLPGPQRPSSTLVGVAALFSPQALFEVDGVAGAPA